MPSSFDFLQPDWSAQHDDAGQAEQNVFAAPRSRAFSARRALERMVKWLYDRDADLRKPYQDNLAALIREPTFRDILPPDLVHHVRLIHKLRKTIMFAANHDHAELIVARFEAKYPAPERPVLPAELVRTGAGH